MSPGAALLWAATSDTHALGHALPVTAVVPFVALLLAIALLPLAAPHWWDSNRNEGIVAAQCAVPVAVCLLAAFGPQGVHEIAHTARDYIRPRLRANGPRQSMGLDAAPTYLAFAATAAGVKGIAVEGRYLGDLVALGPEAARLLAAVSAGAVLMGANTYIGTGPNFMVKAIAEENGVAMPSFFGYAAYSVGVLIPIFVAVTFAFF